MGVVSLGWGLTSLSVSPFTPIPSPACRTPSRPPLAVSGRLPLVAGRPRPRRRSSSRSPLPCSHSPSDPLVGRGAEPGAIRRRRFRPSSRLGARARGRGKRMQQLQPKQMHWVRADASDFGGDRPAPRSGHTAVSIKSKVVVFGGFADRRFIADVSVYDVENKLWYTPECTGNGSDGQVGPSARAFHIAVVIDCNMFIFGGRSGGKRLGDFWMLDTDLWQWSELTGFGDLPSPREFAAASAIGNRKIVMYGGWDGKRWLSDVYIMDTMSLEWTELAISGSLPPPRCGHSATMIEKRLLVFGGRGVAGPIMGDLWALKGITEEEDNETPGWTQLKLPGQSPSPRCGHSVTSGGPYLLLFGGHGTGGWLSRYDVYYNECIILDRVSVQWKRLPTSNEPPPSRAYHSMTSIGSRFLLFGGFDGKNTFGDLWWLVPEDDPIAKQDLAPTVDSDSRPSIMSKPGGDAQQSNLKESQAEVSPITELAKRLGIPLCEEVAASFVDEINDNELVEFSSRLAGQSLPASDQAASIQVLRDHWRSSPASSLQLQELGPLLRDYQRLILRRYLGNPLPAFRELEGCRFFHLKSASQLRMDDIPILLSEYGRLLSTREGFQQVMPLCLDIWNFRRKQGEHRCM